MATGRVNIVIEGQDKTGGAFNSALGNFRSLGKVAAGAMAAGLVAGAAAVAGVGVAAIRTASDFQEATGAIIAGTGASGDSLAEMEQIVKNLKGSSAGLGMEFGDLGTVVADINTRTGATGETLEDLSSRVLQLSRVTGTDATQNVAVLTRVMGDWGVSAEDSAGLMDTLFAASQQTGIGVDQLSRNLVQFGAPMRQFGFSIEESTALLGKWEKEGVNTELVLGSLRIAMGKFAREGVPMREGLEATIAQIQELGPSAEATALAMDVFGARAGPDMAAAILEGRFEIDELVASLENSSGALDDAASRSITFSQRIEIMKSRALTALIPLGDVFINLAEIVMPLIEEALDRLMPIVEGVAGAISNLVENVQSGMSPLDVLSALTYDLAEAFGVGHERASEVAATVSTLIVRAQKIVGPIAAAIASFVGWQDVLAALGVAIAVVVVPAIVSIVSPILAVIAIAAAVSVAIAALRKAWETNFLGIQDKTRAVISFISNLITTVIGAVRAFWEQNGDAILASARNTWESIKAAVTAAINFVQSIIEAVTSAIRSSWDAHGASILASAQNFWSAIKGFIEGEINAIREVITNVANAIRDFWGRHGEEITEGARSAWERIKTLIDNSMANIKTLFDTFTDLFSGDWEGFLNGLKSLWQGGWENIGEVIGIARDTIGEVIKGIIEDALEPIRTKIGEVQATWSEKLASIQSAVDGPKQRIEDFWASVRGFYDWLKDKVFNFSINLPSLPSWATPGSPLPIHTAWKEFAQDLSRIATKTSTVNAMGHVPEVGIVAARASRTMSVVNNFNLNATYEHQPRRSLVRDVRTLELLRG